MSEGRSKPLTAPLFGVDEMRRFGLRYDLSEQPQLQPVEAQKKGRKRNKGNRRRSSSPDNQQLKEATAMERETEAVDNGTPNPAAGGHDTDEGMHQALSRFGRGIEENISALSADVRGQTRALTDAFIRQEKVRTAWTWPNLVGDLRQALVTSGVAGVFIGIGYGVKVLFFSDEGEEMAALPVPAPAKK